MFRNVIVRKQLLTAVPKRGITVNQTKPNKDTLFIADVLTTQDVLAEIDAITGRIPDGYLDF